MEYFKIDLWYFSYRRIPKYSPNFTLSIKLKFPFSPPFLFTYDSGELTGIRQGHLH